MGALILDNFNEIYELDNFTLATPPITLSFIFDRGQNVKLSQLQCKMDTIYVGSTDRKVQENDI